MSAYRRLLAWLEQVFFGGMELAALSTPAFVAVLVLQQRYPDASALAGLTAIAAGSVTLAVLRAGTVDTGAWPRRSELSSLPLRVGYFSVVFLAATIGVAALAVSLGSMWLTLFGGVVQALGLAAFPAAYARVHGDPLKKPAQRV
jgi:hypothetical protein